MGVGVKKKHTYTVVMSTSRNDMAGFLDMLRYDRARVYTWGYDGTKDEYHVSFITEQPATLDRWASFALYPKENLDD